MRILFVPVSGGQGSGEAQRCLMLARALRAQAGEDIAIRFLLHKDAPFPRDEFDVVDLPASPTRSEPEVAAAIADFAPRLCVFDSTLRMTALRAARAAGSRVAYLSVRPHSRWRGLDPRKRDLLDAHFLIAPERLGTRPPWQERLGAKLLPRTRFAYFGVIAERPDHAAAAQILRQHGLQPGTFDLACPGGAGYVVDGLAPMALLAAASETARLRRTVLAVDARDTPLPANWIALPRLPNATLMALVGNARLSVVNGGSLLAQALALHAPCLAVPMQEEQAQRIAAFAAHGALLTCSAQRDAIADAWRSDDDATLQALRENLCALPLRNDLPELAAEILRLAHAAPASKTT